MAAVPAVQPRLHPERSPDPADARLGRDGAPPGALRARRGGVPRPVRQHPRRPATARCRTWSGTPTPTTRCTRPSPEGRTLVQHRQRRATAWATRRPVYVVLEGSAGQPWSRRRSRSPVVRVPYDVEAELGGRPRRRRSGVRRLRGSSSRLGLYRGSAPGVRGRASSRWTPTTTGPGRAHERPARPAPRGARRRRLHLRRGRASCSGRGRTPRWRATRPRPGCAVPRAGRRSRPWSGCSCSRRRSRLGRRRAALPGLVDALCRRGLLERSGGEVAARLDCRPTPPTTRDLWVVSDLTPGLDGARTGSAPTTSSASAPASTSLAQLTIRAAGRSARSTSAPAAASRRCTSPRTAARVVATDVNQRALWVTRLNAALNGVADGSRCATARSSSRSPARRFDLIATNPPFVISPGDRRPAGLPRLRPARRPGRRGHRPRRAGHLNPGGWCQVLANWVIARDVPWDERLAGWLDDDCDALVVQREVARPRGVRRAVAQGRRSLRRRRLPRPLRRLARLVRRAGHRGRSGFGWINLRRHRGAGHAPGAGAARLAVRRRAADRAGGRRVGHGCRRAARRGRPGGAATWSRADGRGPGDARARRARRTRAPSSCASSGASGAPGRPTPSRRRWSVPATAT